jgi:membrane fusion protein (multidrug efflux system)
VGLIVLGVIVAVVAGVLIWRHTRSHETTDDAYVDGVPELVSAQVAGRVLRVDVEDNQDVKAGQRLVELDPADYAVRLEQAQAAAAQARAQLAEARAQQVVDRAQLAEAEASQRSAEANAANAARQLGRYRHLQSLDPAAVSAQQLDSAATTAVGTGAQRESAHKSVAAAQAQLEYAASLFAAAEAGLRSANASIAEAKLTLSYTQVLARIDGRVANKTVAEGNVVSPGMPLMAVVPRDVYVTANLKETQLDHVRRGQPVQITVDAYPELKLTGRVDSVEPATGQTFASLPAQNATGNWVKIVQRVPVKIVFDHLPDDPGQRLAPGMSVEVSIAVQ